MTKPIDRRGLLISVGNTLLVTSTGCLGTPSESDSAGSTPTDEMNDQPNDTTDGSHHGGTTHHGTDTDHHGSESEHEESGSHHHGSLPTSPNEYADVRMVTTESGHHFDPHVVWVKKGGTVTWTLDSGSHSTTAYTKQNERPRRIPNEATGWDSGLVSESEATFERTFPVEGVFDYFCRPHESTGMVASVIVATPPPDGPQPGLQPPQSSLPSATRAKLKSMNEQVNKVLQL